MCNLTKYIYASCFLTANFSLSGNLLIRFVDIAHVQAHTKKVTQTTTQLCIQMMNYRCIENPSQVCTNTSVMHSKKFYEIRTHSQSKMLKFV